MAGMHITREECTSKNKGKHNYEEIKVREDGRWRGNIIGVKWACTRCGYTLKN